MARQIFVVVVMALFSLFAVGCGEDEALIDESQGSARHLTVFDVGSLRVYSGLVPEISDPEVEISADSFGIALLDKDGRRIDPKQYPELYSDAREAMRWKSWDTSVATVEPISQPIWANSFEGIFVRVSYKGLGRVDISFWLIYENTPGASIAVTIERTDDGYRLTYERVEKRTSP
ncbi:MAG: hypothetical protein Q8P01_02040 [bacterium]|nr:hypothetical protein [bacterium]MDP2703981.1 hypothetical protein [bacterium]